MEQDLEVACVHIYAAMGLYEEAVDLALKVRRPDHSNDGEVMWYDGEVMWCV